MNPRSYHHRISTRSSQGAIRCRATTTTTSRAQTIIKSHEFIDNDKLKQIGDAATQASAQRMVRMPVALRIPNLPASISTAVVPPSAVQDTTQAAKSPIVMLHSFDSSCLEYRRLHPRLDQHHPSYAVDLIGWGFTDHSFLAGTRDNIPSIGPEAKREHLKAFVEQCLQGQPIILIGASISGAVALDFALAYPSLVKKLVLLDPQVFIDGLGPMSSAPVWLTKLLVRLLQTEWIRKQAGFSAYFDKETYATDDAVKTGRLHTFLPGWLEANVAFILSGGYSMSKRVGELSNCPFETLCLWGSDDEILDKSYPKKLQALAPTIKLKMVPRCGHTPHLEASEIVAKEVLEFVRA